GKFPVKALIDTISKSNTISKHLFNKLESDHRLEGVVGDDLIGEEIKSLDLQFHIKGKWQNLGDTELIDFQICKNSSFDLVLGQDWLWMREAKISFEFSSETCEHHAKIIIEGMSIPLIDEDFNKASTTKNISPGSDLLLEELTNMFENLSLRSKDNKQRKRHRVIIPPYELSCINKGKIPWIKSESGPSNSRSCQNKSKKGGVKYSTDSDTDTSDTTTSYSPNSGPE
ncbi:3341_t:CDS:2, partial [Diversispora eburnea]